MNSDWMKLKSGSDIRADETQLTDDFAARIGADFYCADGMAAVHTVKKFFEGK